MSKVKIDTELLVLGAVIILLVLGFVQLNVPFSKWQWDNSLPPHRMTVDPFVYTWHARQVYQNEDIYTFTDSVRGLEKIIPTYPPLQGILTASLGKLMTVHIHQLEWILIVIETICVPLGMFLIARKLFNNKIAVITLMLGLFPPYIWLFKTYIGHWGDVINYFFVPAALYLTILLTERRSTTASVLIGILLAAMFIAHASEVAFISAFIIGWLALLTLLGKVPRKTIVNIMTIGLVSALLVVHFFPLMFVVMQRGMPGAGRLPDYYPQLDFPATIIGLTALGLLFIIPKALKRTLNAGQGTMLAFIIFLLAVSSTYLLGLGYRLYRQYYSWYFFFVLIPAVGLYLLVKYLLKAVKLASLEAPAVIILVLIASIILFKGNWNVFSQMSANPIADRTDWEAIEWIRSNTPEDALIYNLDGFPHGFPIYFTDRDTVDSRPDKDSHVNNIALLCQGIYPETFALRCGGGWSMPRTNAEGQPIYITKRTGWNSFEWEEGPVCKGYPEVDVPGFNAKASLIPLEYMDYVLFQYSGTGYDQCMAFFINESITRGHRIIWSNERMAVLEVNKSGA